MRSPKNVYGGRAVGRRGVRRLPLWVRTQRRRVVRQQGWMREYPCYTGVICFDLAPPSDGYKCGECPPGYTGDGETCVDVNECDDGNNGGCDALTTCTNNGRRLTHGGRRGPTGVQRQRDHGV